MAKKKYKLLKKDTVEKLGVKLHRIKALRDFGVVKKGELGGYIESERNLSHEGNCWICDDSYAMNDATVCDNATINSSSCVVDGGAVFENATVTHSYVFDRGRVHGNAFVYNDSNIHEFSEVYDNAKVNSCRIAGYSRIHGEFNFDHVYLKDIVSEGWIRVISNVIGNTDIIMAGSKKTKISYCTRFGFTGSLSDIMNYLKSGDTENKHTNELRIVHAFLESMEAAWHQESLTNKNKQDIQPF